MAAHPDRERLAERLARIEGQVEDNRREIARGRDRLHKLETGAVALTLLGDRVDKLAESVDQIARDAAKYAASEVAERAVETALREREEIDRKRWGLRVQLISIGIGFGGFGTSLAYLFTR